jgi:ElaB/YqjD/DUF883 family membrane-anchored ribosome-binding protein
MINRISEFTQGNGHGAAATVKQAVGQTTQRVKQALSEVEELIAKNPAAALATAFAVGLSIAWWLKRH